MVLLKLFWSFVQIGLFSIGGGYAALPLIQQQVVDIHGWLTMTEFADVITIAEMTPGSISINSATFVGTKIAGMPGAVIATIGCVLPSFVIVLTLAFFYYKYKNLTVVQGALSCLRPAVVSLIANAGLAILTLAVFGAKTFSGQVNPVAIGIILVCLFGLRRWKLSPIQIIAGSGAAGVVIYYLLGIA